MWASTPTMEFGYACGFALGFCFFTLPAATSQALRASSPERGAFGASEFLSCFRFRGKDPRKPKRFSWSVQGGSGGKSKSPRARFLLPAFSFGEAKENAGQQSQISRHTESCSKSPPSFSSKMPPPLSGEAHTRTHRPRRLPLQGGRAGVLYKMGILPNLHKSLTFFRLYFSCFSGTIFFTEEWSIWI